jgi:hypothetical protein
VYSSPLSRAAVTAGRIAGAHGLDVRIHDGLIDIDYVLGVLGLGNDRFWRLGQEPCAINRFSVQDGEFTLTSLNDTSHLEGIS